MNCGSRHASFDDQYALTGGHTVSETKIVKVFWQCADDVEVEEVESSSRGLHARASILSFAEDMGNTEILSL